MLGEKPWESALESLDYHPVQIRLVPWTTAAEPLCRIRRAAFATEQGRDEAIAFADPDTDGRARHWLAITEAGEPVAGVRLLNDRLSQLAVLPTHRRRGIGGALVRRVIHEALDQGLDRLYVHASDATADFYEGLGFVNAGEALGRSDLPHRHMVYDLTHLRPAQHRAPPRASPEDRVRRPLDGPAALSANMVALIAAALRRIYLLSARLDTEVYDNEDIRNALLALATNHPPAEIRILLGSNIQPLIQGSHRLITLARRLPSLIRLRQLAPGSPDPEEECLVTDSNGLLCWRDGRPKAGYAIGYAPRMARQLTERLDDLWHQSQPIVELRTLAL